MFTCSDERTLYTKYVMMQPTLELALYTKYVMTQPTLGTSFVYEVYKYIARYKLKMKNDKNNTGGQKHAGNYFRCNSIYRSG